MSSRYIPKPPLPAQQAQPAASAASHNPTSWKLWHPERGIVFASAAATPASTATPGTATPRAKKLFHCLLIHPPRLRMFHIGSTTSRPMQTAAAAALGADDDDVSPEYSTAAGPATASAAATGENDAGKAEPAKEEASAGKPKEEEEPPVTTLAYKMPAELFRQAKKAEAGSSESFWTYALYRHVDSGARVKVHYCKSRQTTERVCRQYFVGEPVLGFDLEWQPDATRWQGARRNVCLVQLASPSRIGLFHLSLYPATDELVAPTLRQILEDPAVTKTGVFIRGDCTRLRNHLHIEARGTLELSHLHKLVKYSRSGEVQRINKRLVSLAAQAEEHLGLPMFKGQDVRSSDWSKPLSMDQIIYSASDAYAGVQIFSVLENERKSLKPTPPRPAYAELGLPIRLADGVSATPPAEEVAAEEADPDGENAEPGQPGKLAPEFLAAAGEQVEIEAEATPVQKKATPSSSASSPSPSSPASPGRRSPKLPLDARVAGAEEWVARFRTGRRTVRARPASLRAYRLWQEHTQLDAAAVAGLLREPPLQTNTVVGYILEAVRLERLPFDKARLRTELLEQLPASVVAMRYSGLARVCGYDDESSRSTSTTSAD